MPDATKSTAADPLATPLSMPVLMRTGPSRLASASMTTRTRPRRRGRRKALRSRGRLKFRSWRDSAARSTRARSRTGGSAATRARSSGVGGRLSRHEPPPPPLRPRPAPILGGRPSAPRAGPSPPAPAADRRRSSADSGRRRSSCGQQLDPVADVLRQILFDPREQGSVDRAARHELVVRPLVDHTTVDEDHDPIGQMQGGLPIRDEKRGPLGHHRRGGLREWPPRPWSRWRSWHRRG